MPRPEVLLIYPPFGDLTDPYISIPVLAAYLRLRGIPVSAFDAAQALVTHLLQPDRLLDSLEALRNRFVDLNRRSHLTFAQMQSYLRSVALLHRLGIVASGLDRLTTPFSTLQDFQSSPCRELVLQLVLSSFYPEVVSDQGLNMQDGVWSPFSSTALVAGAQATSPMACLVKDIAERAVGRNPPGIVGFSVVFPSQVVPAFQMAQRIRQLHPETHITMGGPFITLHFKRLRMPQVFSVVHSLVFGEGEQPLEALAVEMQGPLPDFSRVPGLVYERDGEVVFNRPAPPCDMTKSPPPDFTVFPLDRYLNPPAEVWIPFRLSRGCAWRRCTFCRTEFFGTRDFQQPPADFVYGQLKHVVEATGIRNVRFTDESADPRVLELVCERLKKDGLALRWTAHTRIDRRLTRARCTLFREGGCERLNVGIESWNDRILGLMSKGITTSLIEEVLTDIKGTVPVGAYLMAGFPTETVEEFRASHERVMECRKAGLLAGHSYSLFAVYSDSHIWNHPEAYGMAPMEFSPDYDLLPDVLLSQGGGERDLSLKRLFGELNLADRKHLLAITEISLADDEGRSEALRFDLSRIVEMNLEGGMPALETHTEWLRKGDCLAAPLEPPQHPRSSAATGR